MFEELIHTSQFMRGALDSEPISIARCEVEAKKKLIKYAKAYGLSDAEVRETRKLLAMDIKQLEILEKRGVSE